MPFAAFREFENHPLFKLLEVTAMSKNREESTNYYLYIDGQAVPVSEQVRFTACISTTSEKKNTFPMI